MSRVTVKDLEKGDWIKDNDPRMPNRRLEIVGFEQEFPYIVRVVARCPLLQRTYRIKASRIFSDGKQRKHGFSRTDGAAPGSTKVRHPHPSQGETS